MTRRPRLLLADDHPLVVAGLTSLLEPSYDLVAAVVDGHELLLRAQALRPDVIVTDISMPRLSGFEVLSDECAHFTQALGIRVRLVVDPALAEPPRAVGLTLYRIVQEALHNVAKHAGAHEVLVTLEPERGGLRLGIHDDGRGFAPGPATRPGLGLFTIRERLQAIGGTLQIDSTPGEGTTILVSVPLTEGHQP